jgi:hypothetical protein
MMRARQLYGPGQPRRMVERPLPLEGAALLVP